MIQIHYHSDYQQINGRNTSGETFRTRPGTIDEVVYSVQTNARGTKHLLILHIAPSPDLRFHPNGSTFLGPHEFPYRDEKDITELLQDFRVTKPQELYDKKVTVYLQQCFWKAGISLPVKEPAKLSVVRE